MRERSVLVTGGASGIGQAVVKKLVADGSRVMIADLDEAAGSGLVSELRGDRADIAFVHTDVSDERSVAAMVHACEAAFGQLDGAVNCAGVAHSERRLHELEAGEFDRRVAINLRGMFLCLKYELEAMRKASAGSIVAISSTAAVKAFPGGSEYCAAKAGVNGLVRAAALEYAGEGIRINAIMPGGTLTPMVQAALRKNPALQQIYDTFPLGRLATADEIAALAVWLLRDEASYMTGASIPVDGALTAG